MKIKWNNCFLCLNELRPLSQTRKKKFYPKVLFKYLLNTRGSTNNQVLKDILQLVDCDEEGSRVQLCEKCDLATVQVSNLHQELEVVQMKLVEKFKQVRETIISNSKLHGQNEVTKLCLGVFEDWLSEQRKLGVDHEKERRIFDVLYAFQNAVFESGKDQAKVPMVFLQNDVISSTSQSCEERTDDGTLVVKTEPVDYATVIHNDASSIHDDDFCSAHDFTEDDHDEEDISLSSVSTNIKMEKVPQELVDDDINDITSRSRTVSKSTKMVGKSRKTPLKKSFKSKPSVVAKACIKPTRGKLKRSVTKSNTLMINQNQCEALVNEDIKFYDLEGQRKPRAAAAVASKRITQVKKDLKTKYQYVEKVRLPKRIKLDESLENSDSNGGVDDNVSKTKLGRLPCASKKEIDKAATKRLFKSRIKPGYDCLTCPYTTKSMFKFEHHLRGHETEDKIFECEQCNKKFSGNQHYEFHMKSHSRSKKNLCDYCNKMFEAAILPDHMKTHGVKFFDCPHCSYCTMLREKYVEHLRVHGTSNLSCDLCPQVFQSRKKYLKHLFDVHKAIEKLVCGVDDCKESFLDSFLLYLHKKVHTNQYACSQCDKVFKDTGALKVHERFHSGEKPFSCSSCSKAFITKAILQRHEIKEHGAPKHKCSYCLKEYAGLSSLKAHIAMHEGTALPCGWCDKSFGNITQLRRHELIHSEVKNFICEECGKAFGTHQLLKRHTTIHVGNKKFKCSYCPQAFVFQKYLTCHLRIHTGERPFQCHQCGKDFNQYAALHVHKRKHSESSQLEVRSTASMDERTMQLDTQVDGKDSSQHFNGTLDIKTSVVPSFQF